MKPQAPIFAGAAHGCLVCTLALNLSLRSHSRVLSGFAFQNGHFLFKINPIDKSEVVLLSSMVASRAWPKSSSHFELVLADCAMCAVRNHPSVPLPPGGRRSRQISRSLTEPSVWVFRRWLTPLLRRSRPCSSSTIGRPVCTSLAIIRVPFTRVAAVGG